MLKNNKQLLIWTSIATIIPGIATWILSDSIAMSLPSAILLCFQWFCSWIDDKINGDKEQNQKIKQIVLWIIPFISLFVNGIFFAALYRKTEYIMTFTCLFMGLLFVLIGNYLPKCKQNATVGIKTIRTLSDEETWNATHRFSGKLWVGIGFVVMLCSVLPEELFIWVIVPCFFVLIVTSLLYPYLYYEKRVQLGKVPKKPAYKFNKTSKSAGVVGVTVGAVAVVFALVLLFTGSLSLTYNEDSFTVQATYWSDVTIDYDSIDNFEYVEDFNMGMRIYGFASGRLNLGTFRNSDLNQYTIYAQGNAKHAVILEIDGDYTVISLETIEDTKGLYDKLTDWRAMHESN